MTGGTVLVSDIQAEDTGALGHRLRRRAAMLSRQGGGSLIAPSPEGTRVLFPGIRHFVVPVVPGSSLERRGLAVADEIGPHLETLRPRLIHVMGLSGALPALLYARGRAKVVLEPGILPSQDLRDSRPDLPADRLVDLVELEDKTLRRADALIAHSMVEMAALVKRGIDGERVFIARDGLPLGVDVGPSPELPHVLVVGDGENSGGSTLPIEALARVKGPWRLTYLLPPGAQTGAIETLARALKLTERVSISRDGDWTNVVSRLNAAKIVVCPLLPTRAMQGGGLVPWGVLLALSAGRALVAADLPAVRAYAGKAARYFMPGDAGALALALDFVLRTDEARFELEAFASEVAESLSWADAEQPVADVWQMLLA